MLRLWTKYRERGFFGWYRYIKDELENQKHNRELIGVDRDGNKYYQYYSHYGLPTRREVRFRDPENIDLKDLVYYRWLYKFDEEPPTMDQKQQFYLEEKLRKERALEWDKKEKQLIEDFKKKRLELLQKNPNLRELDVETNRAILEDIKTKR